MINTHAHTAHAHTQGGNSYNSVSTTNSSANSSYSSPHSTSSKSSNNIHSNVHSGVTENNSQTAALTRKIETLQASLHVAGDLTTYTTYTHTLHTLIHYIHSYTCTLIYLYTHTLI